ncbi:Glucose-6-phosphate dehydrogenase subunit, partial [Arthrobacter sp. ok909]|uniref:OpcA/G6PD domain-containing protein n=1 Tax=Arthrobacter sp. ok909 TaxID=1761746 RepID=UPI0008860AA9
VAVEGASDSPSTILLAAWLTLALDAPVTIVADPAGTGIRRVRLTRTGGDVQLFRPGLTIAELTQPGQPAQRISLPRRSLKDCLAEELRRLDPDEVFGETVRSLDTSKMHQETDMTFTCNGEPRRNRDLQSLTAV